MNTTTRVNTFILRNDAGMLLKYFYPNHSDPSKMLIFNTDGTRHRFHTFNSPRSIKKATELAATLGINVECIEVTVESLENLKEATKELPRSFIQKESNEVLTESSIDDDADMLMGVTSELIESSPVIQPDVNFDIDPEFTEMPIDVDFGDDEDDKPIEIEVSI